MANNLIKGVTMFARSSVRVGSQVRAYAAGPTASKKEILYFLNSEDPEASVAVKSYLKSLYNGAKVEPTETDSSELVAKLEKKYLAAQIVEPGVHNIAVPLGQKGSAPVKRFASQLFALGAQAGFECPGIELTKKFSEETLTAETVKEVILKSKPFISAEYSAVLLDVLQQVETEINGAVAFDAKSEGYKKFAAKVKELASAKGIPVDTIVAFKNGSADEEAADKVSKSFFSWFEAAYTADAAAEVKALEAEASVALDRHLSKTVEQIRKEQTSAFNSLVRKAETAKGAKWAEKYLEDVKAVQWFDASVAENPTVGPKVTVSA